MSEDIKKKLGQAQDKKVRLSLVNNETLGGRFIGLDKWGDPCVVEKECCFEASISLSRVLITDVTSFKVLS